MVVGFSLLLMEILIFLIFNHRAPIESTLVAGSPCVNITYSYHYYVCLNCFLQICYSEKSVFDFKKPVETLSGIKGLSELDIFLAYFFLPFDSDV